MLQPWYLTPISLSLLAEIILLGSLGWYLLLVSSQAKKKGTELQHVTIMAAFIWISTFLIFLNFLNNSLNPRLAPWALSWVFPVLALSLVFLLQFGYFFPAQALHLERERRIVLFLSLIIFLGEFCFTIYRLIRLSSHVVVPQINATNFIVPATLLWVLFILWRQAIAQTKNEQTGWQTLWRPAGQIDRTLRDLLLAIFLCLLLSVLHIGTTYNLINTQSYWSICNAILLLATLLLGSTYLISLPRPIPFTVRMVGMNIVIVLGLLGSFGWFLLPAALANSPRADTRQAARALRFLPQTGGGYRIENMPFQFDPQLGERLNFTESSYQTIIPAFSFPFYGIPHNQINIHTNGFISFGSLPEQDGILGLYGTEPKILACYSKLHLESQDTSGIYVQNTRKRVVISWVNMLHESNKPLTFQVVLYPDGMFTLAFEQNALTNTDLFAASTVSSMTGLVSGNQPAQIKEIDLDTALPLHLDTTSGFVDSRYLDMRQQIHQSMLPLASGFLPAAFITLIATLLFIRINLVKPLTNLLANIQMINRGEPGTAMPLLFNDEIGLLAESFSHTLTQLRDRVNSSEANITAIAQQLTAAQEQIQAEVLQRHRLMEQISKQQEQLASAQKEREKLGLNLQSTLGKAAGQLLSEAQSGKKFFSEQDIEAAGISIETTTRFAQNLQNEINHLISNLGIESAPGNSFVAQLETILLQFTGQSGIQTSLSVPTDQPLPTLNPATQGNILNIILATLEHTPLHNGTTKIEILLNLLEDHLQIILSDNGLGFDLEQISSKGENPHPGLDLLREKSRQIGGKMEARSRPGTGTKLLFSLPLLTQSQKNIVEIDLTAAQKLRLLLVDDSPIFLDGLHTLLKSRGLVVSDTARNGAEAIEKARTLHPDIIIMDVNMPDVNGLEATRCIKTELPETKIVILTVSEDDDILFEAIKSGASGYLLKDLNTDDFFKLLAGLAHGETPLTPRLASRMLAEFTRQSDPAQKTVSRATDEDLSLRQWQILELVAQGLQYKEVGEALHLSEQTVKYHMGQVLERLHLDNRQQAIAYARRQQRNK